MSEELKKAVVVSEEKIQQRSRRRGQFSSSRFPCRKVPKPWQGQHFALPENRRIIFQQRRNLPENLSTREFRTATAFSSFLLRTRDPFQPLLGQQIDLFQDSGSLRPSLGQQMSNGILLVHPYANFSKN